MLKQGRGQTFNIECKVYKKNPKGLPISVTLCNKNQLQFCYLITKLELVAFLVILNTNLELVALLAISNTGELGYDVPLYNGILSMMDDMLGPSPMHIKYVSYVYNRFCI